MTPNTPPKPGGTWRLIYLGNRNVYLIISRLYPEWFDENNARTYRVLPDHQSRGFAVYQRIR